MKRKQPSRPDPGEMPGRLLRFDEADWVDEQLDEQTRASFTALREVVSPRQSDAELAGLLPGIVRHKRRQRWYAAQKEYAAEHGMTQRDLWHLLSQMNGIGAR